MEFDRLTKAVELMSEHMKGDMMSPYDELVNTIRESEAATMPSAPMPQGQGGLGLEGFGGNQPLPQDAQSVVEQNGYTGGPGEQLM